VIFDPVQELAAIINIDDRIGWGPTMIGPQAGELLSAFVDGLPFDISEVGSFQARDFFESWFQRLEGIAETTPEAAGSPVGDMANAGLDGRTDSALASMEAGRDDPPPAQPADTDMGANPGETPPEVTATPAFVQASPAAQEIDCPACNGTPKADCPVCHGSGKFKVS
jgi:hypothetical protein